MTKGPLAQWRANFLAGLAVLLPALIPIGVLIWLFGTVAAFTDALLFFLPRQWTRHPDGSVIWYWSFVAFLLAIFIVCVVGVLARNYFGKRMIQWVDAALMQVPVLNKLYSASKQVNEAFSSGNKNSFKTVALVQFPREGIYSLGFVTNENPAELQAATGEKVMCVFVPTTPNPTTGFLIIIPETQVRKLDISVADAIKYIISLGSIAEFGSLARPTTLACDKLPPTQPR